MYNNRGIEQEQIIENKSGNPKTGELKVPFALQDVYCVN